MSVLATRRPPIANPKARPPLLVEIVGPPGVGKSTLARTLVERSEGVVLSSCLHKHSISHIPHFRGSVMLLPVLLRLFLAERGRPNRKRLKRIAALGAWPQFLHQEKQHGTRAVIVDQGPVYCLIEEYIHFLKDTDRRNLDWCISAAERWAATLDVIVWLGAPETVLAKRIHSRAQPHPLKSESGTATVAWLVKQRAGYERAMHMLMSHARTPTLLRFDTTREPMGQIAEKVLASLAAEGGKAPGGTAGV